RLPQPEHRRRLRPARHRHPLDVRRDRAPEEHHRVLRGPPDQDHLHPRRGGGVRRARGDDRPLQARARRRRDRGAGRAPARPRRVPHLGGAVLAGARPRRPPPPWCAMTVERTRRAVLRFLARARRDPTPVLAGLLALGVLLMIVHWWGSPTTHVAPAPHAAHRAEVVTAPRAPPRARRTSRRARRGGAPRSPCA